MSDDALFKPTITLCADPNDGSHGMFVDGVLVCDSGDEDVSFNDMGMTFWRDALDAAITALGGTLVEESRYRPSRKMGPPFEEGEYESFWPETLDRMGPVEPPYDPGEPIQDEENNPMADWNTLL